MSTIVKKADYFVVRETFNHITNRALLKDLLMSFSEESGVYIKLCLNGQDICLTVKFLCF